MADQIQAYIEASDNASDYADALVEGLEQIAREDIDDLYTSAERRDVELWDAFGVDEELTLDDYDGEEIRGIDWALGLAGISAASQSQFFLDNREDTILKPAAYREQVIAGFALSRAQLVTAGKRGVDIVGVSSFQKLQAEVLERFAFMRELSNVELYDTLASYGAILPPEQLVVNAQGYVGRMTSYPPGSPQFKEEVARLIDTSSGRNLRAMNRRAVSKIHTVGQSGGDIKKPLVWIGEGGPNTCEYCLARFGEVDTYENWIIKGEPGASVCNGGDSCRCQLAAWG